MRADRMTVQFNISKHWANARTVVGLNAEFVTGSDLVAFFGLPFLILTAVLLPQRLWPALARLAVPLAGGLLPAPPQTMARSVAMAIGDRPVATVPGAIPKEAMIHGIARHFLTMRVLALGGRGVRTRVIGSGHIEAALARGRGAVLWDSQFQYANMATKLALARAGIDLVHMSSAGHGVSASWFGRHFLNWAWVLAEAKYLAERVVVSYVHPRTGMTRLAERLRENRVVSVSVRAASRRPATVRFFDRSLRLGPGAPALAFQTGAALLPVFTVMEAPGRYLTIVEAPLKIPARLGRREAVQGASAAYARRLEAHVLHNPGQWSGWGSGPVPRGEQA
ncbi:MAG: hypothetical protein O7A03_02845 [Alphaproteobacteria bacterium]|nr:hypothetical protein [Alphaproteobacteria bacterium]